MNTDGHRSSEALTSCTHPGVGETWLFVGRPNGFIICVYLCPSVVKISSLNTPQKALKFVRQNMRKPQQNPPSSSPVNPKFFPAPACPSQARRQTVPARRKNGGVSSWRGVSWTAAGSVAPRRFRADDGLQRFVARACGRKRRRRCALPAQSMTRTDLPGVEIARGVMKGAALSEGMAANTSFSATPAPSSGSRRPGRFRLAIGRACPMLRSPVKNVSLSCQQAVGKKQQRCFDCRAKIAFHCPS
jgi:hypothetical protein